jgi:ADP-ribose pyrophosphatase YjhB (NUDIX family)
MIQFVGVIVVKQDGSVLSQKIANTDAWGVLGGVWRKEDRDLMHTASRELREKTGYCADVNAGELHYLSKNTFTTDQRRFTERTIYWMLCDERQGLRAIEGVDIKFISLGEFATLKFFEGHDIFLRTAVEIAFHRHKERR